MFNSFDQADTLERPSKVSSGLPKSRGLYNYDLDSLEYQSALAAAINLRRQVYEKAETLFQSSPKILQQLHCDDDNQIKLPALALFSHKFPPSSLNAARVLKRFLQERAEFMTSNEERPKLKVLLDYVNELIALENGQN
ncbi:hypothetical protein K9M09_02345 [Patescibacteria group bacterium]|nr:hypothetical protein [Patescibacteria group bacterium]